MVGPAAARLAGLPWSLVAQAKAAAYRAGLLRAQRLGRPTLSVGALEMGGTGKTPAVAAVARCLQSEAQRPAILSRGYGRRSRGPRLVTDGTGPAIDVTESGDEPALLARLLPGVPVAVAARREQAAAMIDDAAVDVYLLDDGFQHLRVHRDLDLLVVDATRPYWLGSPAPLGRLREHPSAASRATAVLLVGDDDTPGIRRELERRLPGRPIFDLCPVTDRVARWPDGSDAAAGPLLAFAAIARPQRFFDAAKTAGLSIVDRQTFPDHHWFSAADMETLQARAAQVGAEALLTTAKDAIRLEALAAPIELPVHVLEYELRPRAGDALRGWLRQRVEDASR